MKADADRDLYADLEIKPTADANEIKRQFKKLALKYHPDRNPGKELEYNSKFQAIQSANEILTDPQQRAKYDAARMRAGLLFNYTNAASPPTKPNVPPRPTATGFPPPPRPPPAPAPKSQYPPRPSGAQKYAHFSRPESTSTWSTTGNEEAKYKAWDQMRHGQGPIPPRRTVPPKVPRSATTAFQAGREPNGSVPRSSSRGRSDWDRFQESHPGVSRANTSRVSPRRAGFAPGTPGEDERQAPSSYFNISKGDRQTSSRVHTSMQPPPSPVPTARKPDHLHAFKERVFSNEPFGNKWRTSTPYKTDGGERTYFESPGIHRAATSATPQDTKRSTGLYENTHARATAATDAKRNGKGSPEKRQPNLAGMYLSSSSSSSSSEDEETSVPSAKARTTQVPKSRRGRMPAGAHRQTGFNLYARVEDAGDEPMAPQAGLGTGYYTGHRRHSAIDLEKPSDFHNDDAKPDTEQCQEKSSAAPSGVFGSQSDGPKPSLSKSKSWQEKWGEHKEKWGSPPQDKDYGPATGTQAKTPMYASQGFHIPDYSERPSAGTPPFRSGSTKDIDTNFSPDGYHPKFFESSPSRTGTPLRTVSPIAGDTSEQKQQADGKAQDVRDSTSGPQNSTVPPPPPPVEGSYSPEKWAAHLETLSFNMQNPPAGHSRSRTTRKRPRTHGGKQTNSQATVNGIEENPTAASTTGESLDNSKDNSDVDPMDLDEPTPPVSSAQFNNHQTNGATGSPKQATHTEKEPRQGPALPPRPTGHRQQEADTGPFNLGDFKSTFPFAPSNEGLGNMSDMATNLPFESRASPTKPAANTTVSRDGLPNPPIFPLAPRNMTPTTCEHYLKQLRAYMDAWNNFNTNMISALTKRLDFINRGLNCNWLDVKGNGYDDYMKGLEEHKKARVHLDLAYERHETNMKGLGYMRDEIIRGRGGAGRKPSELADMLAGLL